MHTRISGGQTDRPKFYSNVVSHLCPASLVKNRHFPGLDHGIYYHVRDYLFILSSCFGILQLFFKRDADLLITKYVYVTLKEDILQNESYRDTYFKGYEILSQFQIRINKICFIGLISVCIYAISFNIV